MKKLYEVRLSGSGGQGLITAGMILGEAAALFDDKYVVQTQSYGPEARGGAAKSEVIISDEPMNLTKPGNVDILLTLSQPAYDKYKDTVKDDGITIVDSSLVKYEKGPRVYPIPITKYAEEEIGLRVTANVVALGIIRSMTDIVSFEAMQRALFNRIPKGTEEINKKALNFGKNLEYKDNI